MKFFNASRTNGQRGNHEGKTHERDPLTANGRGGRCAGLGGGGGGGGGGGVEGGEGGGGGGGWNKKEKGGGGRIS